MLGSIAYVGFPTPFISGFCMLPLPRIVSIAFGTILMNRRKARQAVRGFPAH